MIALPEGNIISLHIGLYWTAMIANVDGEICCGLAATVSNESHYSITEPAILCAGGLADVPAHDLAKLVHSDSLPEVSTGKATVNALLPSTHKWRKSPKY